MWDRKVEVAFTNTVSLLLKAASILAYPVNTLTHNM